MWLGWGRGVGRMGCVSGGRRRRVGGCMRMGWGWMGCMGEEGPCVGRVRGGGDDEGGMRELKRKEKGKEKVIREG